MHLDLLDQLDLLEKGVCQVDVVFLGMMVHLALVELLVKEVTLERLATKDPLVILDDLEQVDFLV